VVLEERRIDLKQFAAALGAPRFSFGSPELLHQMLGVRPGSVTPFALANDREGRVTVVVDRAMLEHDTAISPADLLRFVGACGYQPCLFDFAAAARA
jgi:Ala-tRNA(Pro) deacylase